MMGGFRGGCRVSLYCLLISLFPWSRERWLRAVVVRVSILSDCHSIGRGIVFLIVVKSAPSPFINCVEIIFGVRYISL